jgi:hypothetical protein
MHSGQERIANMSMNITNMHDLATHFQVLESYHDFEGMVDVKPILEFCKLKGDDRYFWDTYEVEHRDLARSLLLAYLFERADTYGLDELTHDTVQDLWECLCVILNCRWWSKVTDGMITRIEEAAQD